MYSTIEMKMAVCASLSDLPSEIKQLVWQHLVTVVDKDESSRKPPVLKKKSRTRKKIQESRRKTDKKVMDMLVDMQACKKLNL